MKLLNLLKIPKIFDKGSDLISNVAINKILSPVYFFLIFYFLRNKVGLSLFGNGILKGAVQLSLLSSFIYVWCSYYFQPDLDVRKMRPGMNTFPFGSTFLNSPMGLLFLPLQKSLAKIWYYLWHPFALIFTHRGISHWPILSTYLRITYLKIILISINSVIYFIFLKSPLGSSISFLGLFFKQNYLFTPFWMVFCFPVFIVDIFHEMIDFIDSRRKGLSYCPPQIPRGLLANSLELTKKLLKTRL